MGRSWWRLLASRCLALLCFPASGPDPRAGTGDGGEAWRGQESADVTGRPHYPLSRGGGRVGLGGRWRAPVATVTRVHAHVLSLCPHWRGEGGWHAGVRGAPALSPSPPAPLLRLYGSTSQPGPTWPPGPETCGSTSQPDPIWPPLIRFSDRFAFRGRVGLGRPSRQIYPLSDVCIFFFTCVEFVD